jgi:O-antigen/teichoic acid export membrane protein
MILMAILAEPVVLLVLGGQWLEVAPLLRILSPALTLTVPIGLQYAILVAVGAVHRLPRLLIVQTLVMSAALIVGARHGLHAAAWSMYMAMPIVAGLSLLAVHDALGFRWRSLWELVARSACVTLMTAAGPLALSLLASLQTSLASAALAAGLGAIGWVLGLFVSGHAFWGEVCRAGAAVVRLPVGADQRAGR